MKILGTSDTVIFFSFIAMSYLILVWVTTAKVRENWRIIKADIKAEGEPDMCLKYILTDVGMFFTMLLWPIIHLVKFLFCKR